MAETQRQRTGVNNVDIYNIVMLVIDIIVVNVKVCFRIVEAIVKTFLPKEEENVRGQTVLITGTGHGMGKEMALQYGALGAKVICWDINEKNNLQTVKEVKAAGGQAHAYTCNVVHRSEIFEVVDKVKKEHGFVHILVNNAGIMPCHSLLEHTEAEIRTMYDINVLAHFWLIQALLPDMLERNQGHIVAMSSCAGLFPLPNLVPYCGTKFAVRGIMQSLQEELLYQNPHCNIKFTTIYPYMVDTGLCKNPRFRFPKLMKLVNPQEAVTAIIRAQRTSQSEVSIPPHFIVLEKVARLFPKSSMRVVNDFLDTGVDSDK